MRIIYPIEERDLMTKTESYKQPLIDIFRCPIIINLHQNFLSHKNTSYLTSTGKLWGVCCEDLGGNWLYYSGITLMHQTEKC